MTFTSNLCRQRENGSMGMNFDSFKASKCFVLSCLVLSRLVLSCLVLVLSCLVLSRSCLVSSWPYLVSSWSWFGFGLDLGFGLVLSRLGLIWSRLGLGFGFGLDLGFSLGLGLGLVVLDLSCCFGLVLSYLLFSWSGLLFVTRWSVLF